jgi:uncharacterized protein
MNLPVSALMAVCPLVAAVILVHRAEGSAGVKRLLRRVLDYRRIGWRWYLPIVFLNPAILLGSYGVMRWLGRPLPEPHVSLVAAPLLLLVFLPPAVGEEAGWMGYAADPLQDRWGALRAGLLLGTVGALWHVVPLVQAHHDTAWIAWEMPGNAGGAGPHRLALQQHGPEPVRGGPVPCPEQRWRLAVPQRRLAL